MLIPPRLAVLAPWLHRLIALGCLSQPAACEAVYCWRGAAPTARDRPAQGLCQGGWPVVGSQLPGLSETLGSLSRYTRGV